MKRLLLFLVFIPYFLLSQTPQGVGYQGVATDALGIELVNQSISIKASILSSSATGSIEWQEIHNTATDTFGLFNLTIGQGISTGNGAQSSFADITWGANTHFLKIEMDVNGGTNYSHMGTNQMMSVPYALYAENANIDYDSIATIISNDSILFSSFNNGCNSFGNINVNYSNNFIWFNTSQYYQETYFVEVQEDGFIGIMGSGGGSGSASFKVYQDSLSPAIIDHGFSANFYYKTLVPVKKGQFIKLFDYSVGQVYVEYFMPLECGGSSNSSIDSTYIDSLVQFYSSGNGGGCDYSFPDGLDGDAIFSEASVASPYIVPNGKRLYIHSWKGSNPVLNAVELQFVSDNFPMILNSGDTLTTSGTTAGFSAILINETSDVFSITTEITDLIPYQVPSGKKLVILNYVGGEIMLEGSFVFADQWSTGLPIIVPAGISIETQNNFNGVRFNGYLVDENYFAGCGGGGSSSSSSSLDSLTIVSIINNLMSQNFGLSVGDYFQGGIVAYIFQPGDSSYVSGEVHGYVAYSDGSNLPWGCDGITTLVNNTNIGQGPNNTQILDSLCPESNFAAKWCNDLSIGIYDDWFLPNSEEMLLVGLSFIKDYFGDYIHFWISEEFSVSNNNGFPSSTYNSSSHAFTYYIDGTPSMNINCLTKNSLEKFIAFREF